VKCYLALPNNDVAFTQKSDGGDYHRSPLFPFSHRLIDALFTHNPPPTMPPPPLTILGAGLTGLSTAYRLSTLGVPNILLIDKAHKVGGWVDSSSVRVQLPVESGYEGVVEKGKEVEVVIESGPRSIRPRGGLGAARMLQLVCLCSSGVFKLCTAPD
jgi:hypothetical protein